MNPKISDAVKSVFRDGAFNVKAAEKPIEEKTKSETKQKSAPPIQLERGRHDYPFTGELKGARIGGLHGRDIPLMLISAEDMKDRHKSLPGQIGMPVFVSSDGKRLMLHPAPDGAYRLLLR